MIPEEQMRQSYTKHLIHAIGDWQFYSSFFYFFIDFSSFFLLVYCHLGMLTSVPFIVATILVYILIPELHNLHGKCFLCYMICLMVGYIVQATTKLITYKHLDKTRFTIFGYLIYISFISSFLWSNVISYDLWRSFR